MNRITPNVMGVTWLTATTKDRGDIPLEPLLYVGLEHKEPTLAEAIAYLPRYLRLIWPGGVYQVLDAHTQQQVFVRDSPVDPASHETFRRLTHHWGWWFMRLVWSDRQKQMFFSDFQIMQVGGKVFPLQSSIETALNDLNLSRQALHQHLTAALQYPPDEARDEVATEQIEKYEALVGPLPAHLSTLSAPPGTQVVVDRRKFLDGELRQADITDAMWATQGKPRFDRVIAKPDKVIKEKRDKQPCERCGKDGPRYHYSVKIGGNTRNVCMDCADELGASEVFKEKPAAPKKSDHDAVVEGYLDTLNAMYYATTLPAAPDRLVSQQDYRHIYAALKEARIYELTSTDLSPGLMQPAWQYLAQIAGIDGPPAEHINEIRRAAALLIPQMPMPSPLPFPSIYVGWGQGYSYVDETNPTERVIGWLLTETGDLIAFSWRLVGDARHYEVAALPFRRPAGWNVRPEDNPAVPEYDYCDIPWIATLLVAALNDKQTIVLRQEKTPLRERLQFEKASKKARQRFLPRPYYTVTIQEQVVQDHARKLPRLVIPREWSHRFDRDAHYRHFVRRGPLPLGDRKRQALQQVGFAIFTDPAEVTGEAMAILMRRGVPQMKAGEWLATKKTHVDAQLQIPHGRTDLPYVPAVRKPEGPLIPDPSKSK